MGELGTLTERASAGMRALGMSAREAARTHDELLRMLTAEEWEHDAMRWAPDTEEDE